MPRRLRVAFPGAIYHVTVRGNRRRAIFQDHRDRENFSERLGHAVETYGVRLYLYCLLSNHYHLVVETPQPNLSPFMGALGTGHAVYFNKRHGEVGHLYQGRFNARLVQGDDYLLKLSRYVHLNPVQTKPWLNRPLEERLRALREYEWSSFRAYLGTAPVPEWLTPGPVLAQLGGGPRDQTRRYRTYVESGLAAGDEEFQALMNAPGVAIGNDEFARSIETLAEGKVRHLKRAADSDFRPTEKFVPAEDVLKIVAAGFETAVDDLARRRRDGRARAAAARMLVRYSGLSRRAAAAALGLTSGAAVSWLMGRRLPAALAADAALRETLGRIERELQTRARA